MLEEKIYNLGEWREKILPLVQAGTLVKKDDCNNDPRCKLCDPNKSGVKTISHKKFVGFDRQYDVHFYRALLADGRPYVKLYDTTKKLKKGRWSAEDWNARVLPAIKYGFIRQIKTTFIPKDFKPYILYSGILEEQGERFEVSGLIDGDDTPYIEVINYVEQSLL